TAAHFIIFAMFSILCMRQSHKSEADSTASPCPIQGGKLPTIKITICFKWLIQSAFPKISIRLHIPPFPIRRYNAVDRQTNGNTLL
ncbi:hypothetical protein MM809_39240, partial [Klebsiella pneumoniae]|nr:hypothetical protein [Klebsiella pneumoniae]